MSHGSMKTSGDLNATRPWETVDNVKPWRNLVTAEPGHSSKIEPGEENTTGTVIAVFGGNCWILQFQSNSVLMFLENK